MDIIAEQFAKASSLDPATIAIDDGRREFTYKSLLVAMGGVSARLADLDVRLEADAPRVVAILAAHSADAAAISVGIVLAGWAYTPLDTNADDSVLKRTLADGTVSVVLADGSNAARAHAISNDRYPVLRIEEVLAPLPLTDAVELITSSVQAKAPAYILYTSGTSGQPKSVTHDRASLMRSVRCYCEDSELLSNDRVSLVMPLGFTPSVFSLFGALLTGATVCMYDINQSGQRQFEDWVRRQKLTLLYTTPTLFRRWANGLENARGDGVREFASLRMIQLAGEPLLASDVDLFQRVFPPSVRLYNGMGTAETSCVARFVIDHSMSFLDGSVPMGYPYDDMDLVIRNDDGRMVGAGEIGHLLIKSKLSDGHDCDVEFETFDLAMQEEGGRFVHCGRRGDRVHIDGVWVDLLEIESLLMRRADVLEATVIVTDISQRAELAAFISLTNNAEATVSYIKDWLAKRLPAQMIPTHWIITDTLPTLNAGKVDRMALEANVKRGARLPKPLPGAPDDLEIHTLALFRTLLDAPDLEPNANFFASGGTIPLALELTMDIERKFGVGLSVSQIGHAPTSINLAHELRRKIAIENGPLKPMSDLGALWELDYDRPLLIDLMEAAELPEPAQSLLNHQNSMTQTLSKWTGEAVSLNVRAQRQVGHYFVRKIELVCAPERTLAVAGIRIDLSAFDPAVRLEIIAGNLPFGSILRVHNIAVEHTLQHVFKTKYAQLPSYGRINRIEAGPDTVLADVIEVLSP